MDARPRTENRRVRSHGLSSRGVVSLPPYPTGWYAFGLASELAPGGVLSRPFMGDDLVVYRTRSGVLRAVEPYCPHLGAHLGHGGRVDGELIVCAFHAFAYDTAGACVRTTTTSLPYSARSVVPAKAPAMPIAAATTRATFML